MKKRIFCYALELNNPSWNKNNKLLYCIRLDTTRHDTTRQTSCLMMIMNWNEKVAVADRSPGLPPYNIAHGISYIQTHIPLIRDQFSLLSLNRRPTPFPRRVYHMYCPPPLRYTHISLVNAYLPHPNHSLPHPCPAVRHAPPIHLGHVHISHAPPPVLPCLCCRTIPT